jgi:hypothetical protein
MKRLTSKLNKWTIPSCVWQARFEAIGAMHPGMNALSPETSYDAKLVRR